jgi:hypothetical protein
MSDLCDIDHLFGEDIGITPTGDIAVVSNHDRTVQRVIRRILTAQTSVAGSAYPFQPEYGAGLPQKIGQENIDIGNVKANVLSQLLLESTVARIPLPTVSVSSAQAGSNITINVTYTDTSGTPQSFGFDLA